MVKTAEKTKSSKTATASTTGEKKTKKPQNAYMFWLAEHRAAITAKGFKGKDVLKEAGAQWKVLADKSKWEKMASDDRKSHGLGPVGSK